MRSVRPGVRAQLGGGGPVVAQPVLPHGDTGGGGGGHQRPRPGLPHGAAAAGRPGGCAHQQVVRAGGGGGPGHGPQRRTGLLLGRLTWGALRRQRHAGPGRQAESESAVVVSLCVSVSVCLSVCL